MNKGWISIYRKIQDCAIWDHDEPFDKRSAWIDLLLLCNHRDKEIIFNGKMITIYAGQYLTSVRALALRWHWSNDRTLRYLRLLVSMGMIEKDSDRNRTLLTVVNYGIYQDIPNTYKDTHKDTDEYTPKYTGKDTDKSQTINKQLNNENNVNKKDIYRSEDIHEIIDYLNQVCGTHYRYGDKTVSLIRTRMKEGFTVDDFKTVIDKKFKAWGKGDMAKYLRPETLFGTKFESYLNEKGNTNGCIDDDERSRRTREESKRLAEFYGVMS